MPNRISILLVAVSIATVSTVPAAAMMLGSASRMAGNWYSAGGEQTAGSRSAGEHACPGDLAPCPAPGDAFGRDPIDPGTTGSIPSLRPR